MIVTRRESVLFAIALIAAVLGFSACMFVSAKVDAAYCASGAHGDPCPGKYGGLWIYCDNPLASGVCMTATDGALFWTGYAAMGSGLFGVILLLSREPKEQGCCPTCGRPEP